MNKKKLIAAVICLVLVITAALPGTLAVSADAASSDGTISVATPETAQTPDDSAVTDDAAPQSESETPAEPKTCTCDPAPAEGEAHKEGCPLYVAPEKPAEEPKTCTCDPAPAEGEAHKEGCPLYVAPEKPDEETPAVHIEGCSDDCKAEDCKCACHLFDKIMACTTLDDIWAIMDHMTDEQWDALSEAQMDAIDQLIARLDMQMVPVQPEADNNPQIESEIIYPTVTYTYVAPFGDPVTGGYR